MSGWSVVGPLNDVTSFAYERALNRRSGWVLKLPYSDASMTLFDVSGSGVRVVDNGQSWVGVTKRVELSDGVITVSGVSLLSILADRVPIPEPANTVGPWATNATHNLDGVGAVVLKALIDAHGSGVRALPGGWSTTQTPSVLPLSLRSRWAPSLLEIVEGHATSAGVSVDVTIPPGVGASVACTVRPLGSAPAVVFDPDLGGRVRPRLVSTPEAVTHVYVGGGGEGTSRTVVLVTGPGPRRVERWVESSGDDADGKLTQEGQAVIDGGGSRRTIEVELDDAPGMTFGVDYVLGDLVSVRARNFPAVEERVTRVGAQLSAAGVERTVTVGDGVIDLVGRDDSSRRLGRLEGA